MTAPDLRGRLRSDLSREAFPLLGDSVLTLVQEIHTVPEIAAKVFNAARPKVAVSYHQLDSGGLSRMIREQYEGEFVAGEDLMTFVIGDEVALVER